MAAIPVLELQPAIYSRHKQVEQLIECIKHAPKQIPNSDEAINGMVADFVLKGTTRPYGTLTEYAEHYEARIILVYCTDGKVHISVENNTDGRYFFVRGFSIVQ